MSNIADYIEILPGEEWRSVVGHPKYSVSNKGRLFSWKPRPKEIHGLMKPSLDPAGYPTTVVDYKAIKVHRLVALTFIPNPDNKPEVHHIDHVKSNNCVENLMWVTHLENIRYSYEFGHRYTPKGKDHWAYGKTFAESSRKLMSDAKMGSKHPKFKGYYIIDGVEYESANQAGIKLGIPSMTITRRTKNPKFTNYTFKPCGLDNNKPISL